MWIVSRWTSSPQFSEVPRGSGRSQGRPEETQPVRVRLELDPGGLWCLSVHGRLRCPQGPPPEDRRAQLTWCWGAVWSHPSVHQLRGSLPGCTPLSPSEPPSQELSFHGSRPAWAQALGVILRLLRSFQCAPRASMSGPLLTSVAGAEIAVSLICWGEVTREGQTVRTSRNTKCGVGADACAEQRASPCGRVSLWPGWLVSMRRPRMTAVGGGAGEKKERALLTLSGTVPFHSSLEKRRTTHPH